MNKQKGCYMHTKRLKHLLTGVFEVYRVVKKTEFYVEKHVRILCLSLFEALLTNKGSLLITKNL